MPVQLAIWKIGFGQQMIDNERFMRMVGDVHRSFGLFVGLSMTAVGGAWDNAKKMIEGGAYGGKGAIPAINPMIKVTNIVAILAIAIFF